MKNDMVLQVRLSHKFLMALREEAKRQRRSVSGLVRAILEDAIDAGKETADVSRSE